MRLLADESLTDRLFVTKLDCPLVGFRIVRRRRLTDILEAGLSRKLTVVAAPVGYGKTVLLGEWLSTAASRDTLVAWLSLDSGDNEPSLFWSAVLASLRRAYPNLATSFPRSSDAATAEVLSASLFLNRIAKVPGQICLVLDNYDCITDPFIHKELDRMLDNLPRNMHLFLSSRVRPPIHLARLRAQGQLAEISAKDLAFTLDETDAFLRDVIEMRVDRHKVFSLQQMTEGWIGAIRLAALATTQSEKNDPLSGRSFGNVRILWDYIAEEVLSAVDEDTKTFLLRSSILNELSAPLCDAILGRQDSQEVLKRLEDANLFLIPVDDARSWYRYHCLVLQSLRAHLQRSNPRQFRELHYSASIWLFENGHPEMAVSHALAANDLEKAAEMLDSCAECAVAEFNIENFVHWIDALPEELMYKRPRLGIFRALACYWLGQDRVLPVLEMAEKMVKATPGTQKHFTREIEAIKLIVACAQGDPEATIRGTQRLLDNWTDHDYFSGMLTHFIGYAHESVGDLEGAAKAFDSGAQIALTHHALITYAFSRCEIARIHKQQARLYLAEREYRQMLDFANCSELGGAVRMFAQAGLAEVLLERNDKRGAAQLIQEVLDYLSQPDASKMVWIYSVVLRTKLASYFLAIGDYENARRYHTSVRHALRCCAQALNNLLVDITGIQVSVWLATHDLERASGWMRKRACVSQRGSMLLLVEQMNVARIHLALQQPAEALSVLREAEGHIRKLQLSELLIQLLGLKSVALRLSGAGAEAQIVLNELLHLSEPEGHIRQLLYAGPALLDLIEENAENNDNYSSDYLQRLRTAFGTDLSASNRQSTLKGRQTVVLAPIVEPLSRREAEVLGMLTEYKCAKDIATSLGVSVNTAKAHIKSVYRKLAVHTQKEACLRAREMELSN